MTITIPQETMKKTKQLLADKYGSLENPDNPEVQDVSPESVGEPENPEPTQEGQPQEQEPGQSQGEEYLSTEEIEQLLTQELEEDAPFGAKLDPTKLPPEMQEYYKSLQAGFTKHTQKAAEMEKAAQEAQQSLQAKLEELDTLLKQVQSQQQDGYGYEPESQPAEMSEMQKKLQEIRISQMQMNAEQALNSIKSNKEYGYLFDEFAPEIASRLQDPTISQIFSTVGPQGAGAIVHSLFGLSVLENFDKIKQQVRADFIKELKAKAAKPKKKPLSLKAQPGPEATPAAPLKSKTLEGKVAEALRAAAARHAQQK